MAGRIFLLRDGAGVEVTFPCRLTPGRDPGETRPRPGRDEAETRGTPGRDGTETGESPPLGALG